MPYHVDIKDAEQMFPDYTFVGSLTPSEQKAAFHVKDKAGTDLCLKLIAPHYERDRLDREIQALQTINHPNVVKLIEYTFSSRPGHWRHYIVEEFIEGRDLQDILISGKPWPIKAAVELFSSLCDGLFAMKEKEIVHRDIKPANIRVRPDNRPVLIDFGLARHLTLPDLTQTAEGAAIGTPIYFAPEQFEGTKHDIDHRTDLFALGILLYEAITGESPFYSPKMTSRGQLQQAVCESSVHLKKASFLALDEKWRVLLARLLEKERAKRPSDARQVGTILRKLGGL
jgi:eukaryotic-like serine/threonine-protein kinase